MALFRKAVEPELDVLESHLRLLVESSPEGMVICDTLNRIVFANAEFCRMFGWEHPEVTGNSIDDIVANSDEARTEASAISSSVFSSPHILPDTFRAGKDGKNIPISLLAGPIQNNGKVVGAYGIYRDISSRKNAEAAISQEKALFEKLFRSSPDAITLEDTEGTIIKANDAFYELFGYSGPDEVIGKNANTIVAQDPEIREECEEMDRRFWNGENIDQDIVRQRKDGSYLHLAMTQTPFSLPDGALLDYVIYRNIEDRIRAKQEMRHLNTVLRSIRGVNRLINRHHDRERLIQEICTHIIETRGYRNVWIGILGSGGKLASVSEAGIGPDGKPLSERIKQGTLNEWGLSILEKPGVSLKHGIITMTDCPLLDSYEESGIMATRLEYDGKIYGLMSVSVPSALPTDIEEQSLFAELAEDIAFALHAIEVETDREQKSAILERNARQLELLLKQHSDGLWEWDLEEGRVNMNPNYETMLGYDPGELNRSFEGVQSKIHPEDLHGALAALKTIVERQGNGDLYEAVYRMRTKDGGWKKILDSGYVLRRDRFGRACRMVGTHVLIPDTPTGKTEREDPES